MRLVKMQVNRREADRREALAERTLSSCHAFDAEERAVFQRVERRRQVRRDADVRRAIAQLER